MTMGLVERTRAPEARRTYDWTGLDPWRSELTARLAPHCRDSSEVEDIVQETFIRAARSRTRLRSPERLRSWLVRIAFNTLRDDRRRSSGKQTVPIDEALDVPDEEFGEPVVRWRIDSLDVPEDEVLLALERARQELPSADRELIDTYYEADDPERAAAAARIPRRLVKVRLFRARGRIKRSVRRMILERQPSREVLSC